MTVVLTLTFSLDFFLKVLILENDSLKREITRLKRDNANLLKDAKKSRSDRDEALHHYATSEAARKELMKRYEKQISQVIGIPFRLLGK